jgi:hypothetical protein
METNERAVLQIISDHLAVTADLLDYYEKLEYAVRRQSNIAAYLPVELPSKLQALQTCNLKLREQALALLLQGG